MTMETKKRKISDGDKDKYSRQKLQGQTVLIDQSLSVAGRPLPAAPVASECTAGITNADDDKGASIVLFYQYKEPVWTEQEFQRALKLFVKIGRKHSMTGRGRIAPEGVNCTLTGPSADKVRGFCQALRDEWGVVDEGASSDGVRKNDNDNKYGGDKDLFKATDFKITDGLPQCQKFKSLSIRKTNELVAYGLEGEKAPSIEKFGGEHLTAIDYHEALKDKDTVVIDVRNAYETAIGTIVPPEGGATLLDPKLRNSREWPKWLASEETQKKLNGKKILTFCTGGIRCERATALINQMATVSASEQPSETPAKGATSDVAVAADDSKCTTPDNDAKSFQPNGVYHMRGGIERYLKTYPQGGFWSGKNYLFDKRMEQLPELKASSKVEDEVAQLNARCCLCRKPWTTYRGQHKCGSVQCGVPVLVCDTCHISLAAATSCGNAGSQPPQLRCELCRQGYRAPQGNPDLVAMRKRAEKLAATGDAKRAEDTASTEQPKRPPFKLVSDRLFLNRLPLTTRKSEIEEWLRTPIRQFHWITDRRTGVFYGSCIVRIDVFSKVLLAIKKKSKVRDNAAKETRSPDSIRPTSVHKIDENIDGGSLREFLGPFPGTTPTVDFNHATKKVGKTKIRRRQQQPKIFRVLARPGEPWPPPDHNDKEYPPLGRIQ